ncbi:unnamed protein product [Dibothriocephalus latus]|uniref:Uncharacterized protein n=1 Tax=Dibothriocephalus latus TaxID=60516 RepID=A0A3P7P410_DIBLA|nr:unnamed protein product [Dibothriocephalus latus]
MATTTTIAGSGPVAGPHLAESLVCTRGLQLVNRGAMALGIQASIRAPNFFVFEDGTQVDGLPRLNNNRQVRIICLERSRWPQLHQPSCTFVLEPGCKKLFGFVFQWASLIGRGMTVESRDDTDGVLKSLFNETPQRAWSGRLHLRVCSPKEVASSVGSAAVLPVNATAPALSCAPLRVCAIMKMPRLDLLSPTVVQGGVTFVGQTSTLSVRLANRGASREAWVLEEFSSILYKPSMGSLKELRSPPIIWSSSTPSECSEPGASVYDSEEQIELTQSRSAVTVSSQRSTHPMESQVVQQASEAFIFTTKSGFLEAAGDVKRQDVARVEVTFAPKEDGVFEKVVCFVGQLSGDRIPVTFTAAGSFDERFDQHFAE